jgi:hypothetical protein
MQFGAKSAPRMAANRARRPSFSGLRSAARRSDVRLSCSSVNATSGRAMARRFTTSDTAIISERSDFMNLSRAGVAKKRSRTSTRVPLSLSAAQADGFTG